ncbi:MAG TPA: sulfotransferase [Acidimicrobiales bacterium]|nr:sulfotransferase [Acidimicrobiales bacterium]
MLVDSTTVDASPIDGRLALIAGIDADPLGASVERALARLWGFFRADAEEGPGALVTAGHFARALRHLADALIAPALASAGDAGVEIVIGDSAMWQALYPELCGLPPSDADPGELGPAPRLVVVLGCGRSGTTWLERLLMAHRLAGGAEATESFLFSQAAPVWREVDRADGLGRWFDRTSIVPVLRSFVDEVLAATVARHRPGATVVVEKTPKHVFELPEIRALFPDACYLHLLRDGRDVARSVSQVPFFECPTPADGAALWDTAVDMVRRGCVGAEHFREVRYESLVADPVGTTTSLWTWMGLEPTAEAVDELQARVAPRVSRHAGTAHAVGAGSWQALSAADLAGVYAEAGRRLVQDGYASASSVRRAMTHPAYWQRWQRKARRRRAVR